MIMVLEVCVVTSAVAFFLHFWLERQSGTGWFGHPAYGPALPLLQKAGRAPVTAP
jgi:hypothetical protein